MRHFILIYGLLFVLEFSCKNSTKTELKSNNQIDSTIAVFRNINWQMSYDDVKKNEKGELMIDSIRMDKTRNLVYVASMLDEEVNIFYIFNKDDSLVRSTISFPIDILSLNKNVEKYEAIKKLLTKKYGISKDHTKWNDKNVEKDDSLKFGQHILLGELELACGWYIKPTSTLVILWLKKSEGEGMSLLLNYTNGIRFKKEVEEKENNNLNDL